MQAVPQKSFGGGGGGGGALLTMSQGDVPEW